MPDKSSVVPKYGLHKPTGQARVVLDGHSHYLGRYGTQESRERYEQLISIWVASSRTLPSDASGPSGLTVNELLVAYLRHSEGYYVKNGKPTSEYTCMKAAVKPLQELYGGLPAAEFSPLKLKSVRQKLIDVDLSRGLSINTSAGSNGCFVGASRTSWCPLPFITACRRSVGCAEPDPQPARPSRSSLFPIRTWTH
jgi:hypothetical protein